MPQMGPLMWLNLMLMFLFTFLIFFSMTYFNSIPVKPKVSMLRKSSLQKIWKW